jgi:hypothetical protein
MELVRLFFGPNMDDTRGDVFFNLAYNGTQYDKAINADNVNSLLAEPLLQVMLNKNYKAMKENDIIHEEFIKFITDIGVHHRNLDDKSPVGTDQTKLKVLEIYRKPNVPVNVRKFFETHLKVLDMTTNQPVTVNDLTDPHSVRLNLVKVSAAAKDKENILFATTLPLIPTNIIKNNFLLMETYYIALAKSENDASKFRGAMNAIASMFAYVMTPITYVMAKSSGNKKFDFDIKELIKNTIIARDTRIPPSSTVAEPLEDLYESVVTGVRYARDANGKLRQVNEDGKLDMSRDFEEGELETALNRTAPNCASTGIDNTDCNFVYKCLLSGKPETLAECLDKLKNADMFAVARKEVAIMNPKVAVQLLRTFGFKPRREAGSNVVLPPTFDEWSGKLSRTVDTTTAEAIRGNKKLMEYLRAVVDMVRANPAIINTDLKNGVLSDFAKKTGLSVFRNPFPERTVHESVVDGLLFAPTQVAQSMQLPLALQIANVSGRVRNPFMVGGGNVECPTGDSLKQAFNMIFAEMEKNGKVLIDSDKARINSTIDKLKKLESNLMQLMDDAKLFSKLNAALNPAQSVSTENVTLRDITDVRNQSITGETLGNLNDCIAKNLRDQTQLSSDLVSRVQMPLLQLLLKGGSNALSPVN